MPHGRLTECRASERVSGSKYGRGVLSLLDKATGRAENGFSGLKSRHICDYFGPPRLETRNFKMLSPGVNTR